MITVKAIGGDALLKKFEKMGEKGPEIFKEVVDDTAIAIYNKAKSEITAKVDYGSGDLHKGMYFDLSGSDFAIVGNRAIHAPYVEFGTGMQAQVPAEFSSIASAIRSRPKRKFKEGLQRIKDWCKMKGIDVKAAYPIFMSILRTGVRPRPFMYPAYRFGIGYMAKEAAIQLNKLTKIK